MAATGAGRGAPMIARRARRRGTASASSPRAHRQRKVGQARRAARGGDAERRLRAIDQSTQWATVRGSPHAGSPRERGPPELTTRSARGRAQLVDAVEPLPRQVEVLAAEVAIGRGLAIDRATKVERVDDRARPEVERAADELREVVIGERARCPTSGRSRRADARRRWRRPAGARSGGRGRRRRGSSRRSAPCTRPIGRPSSGPCR